MADWVEGYKKALWAYYIASCGVVDKRSSIYGWQDYEETKKFRRHMKGCRVDVGKTRDFDDVSWEEFQGTFTDNHTVYGMATDVTCICGHVKNVKTRYDGRLSEMILGVLAEAEKADAKKKGD